MGIKLSDIQDPRLRARVQQALDDAGKFQEQLRVVVPQVSPMKSGKRIRQSRDKPNKLEQEFAGWLSHQPATRHIRAQAMRFKLANGLWYKPDVTCLRWIFGSWWQVAYEVKGPHAFRGGFENLKVAATQWPDWKWILVWKQDGKWLSQEVLA